MKWAKIASNLHTHPKVRRAGRDGRDVFLFLLLKNAELEANGVLDAQYVDPDYLADMLGVTHETACNGVKRSIVSSLIVVENGVVRIVGWNNSAFQSNVASSTERVRKHREKQKRGNDETPCNVSCNNGNGETPKRRVEESRSNSRPNRSAKPRFDLEAAYASYPRKAGKKTGMAKLERTVRTPEDLATLLAAAGEMARLWAGGDLDFCPLFSTWVNQERWRDPVQVGPSRPEKAPSSPESDLIGRAGAGRPL